MRVLVTTFPGIGHFHPLAPLALALQAAGHEVVVATGPDMVEWVRRCGFPALAAGLTERDAAHKAQVSAPPGVPFGPYMFARIAPGPMLDDLRRHSATFAPDVVIHEESEYAGPLLAAERRLPLITHSWPAPARGPADRAAAEAGVAELWNAVAPSSPPRVTGDVYLDACPPPLQTPELAAIPNVRSIRPEPFDGPPTEEVRAFRDLARPVAYVSFGTVADFVQPEALRTAVLAAAREAATVIVTTGPLAPHVLDPLPANVIASTYLPQRHALEVSDIIVCHGGAGSALGALRAGLPHVVLPQGAQSQQRVGDRIAAVEVGVCLPPTARHVDDIARAIRTVLNDPSYAAAAKLVAAEIDDLPGPARVAAEISEFVTSRPRDTPARDSR